MKKVIRYNNPGMLQAGPIMFIGENPEKTENNYRQFYEVVWGYRAMFRQLQAIINLRYNTIRKIVIRWEPRSREKTELCINFIVENTSIKEDEIINAEDKINLVKIVSAISHYENEEIPDATIVLRAWELLPIKKFQ